MKKILNYFLLMLDAVLSKVGRIIAVTVVVILTFSIIFIVKSALYSTSKNYVCIMNNEAKSIFKCIKSEKYNFDNYCKEYNIPENGIIYISGSTTNYNDLIIDANKYCIERKNITVNPSDDTSIYCYWTIKIDNNVITEIWTYKVPLHKNQLRAYSFDEQVEIIPYFKKNKFNYAIGYYITNQ